MKSQDLLLLLKLICLEKYDKIQPDIQPERANLLSIIDDSELHIKTENVFKQYQDIIYKYKTDFLKENYRDTASDIIIKASIPLLFSADKYTLKSLEASTGISKSQISLSLKRCIEVRLLFMDSGKPLVNKRALFDIIKYAIPYVFPIEKTASTKGIPISFASPFLYHKIMATKQMPLVWPDPKGFILGDGIIPINKAVPHAVKRDPLLYEILVLIESVRMNSPREKKIALDTLEKLMT